MAITQVGSTTTDTGSVDISGSYTQASGDNLILVACITAESIFSANIISASFNGVALTKLVEDNNTGADFMECAIWYLVDPDVGTYTFSVNVQGPTGQSGVVLTSWSGVNQSVPFSDSNSATGTSSSPSVSVNSAVGELVIDNMQMDGDSAVPIVGSGQTVIANWEPGGDYNNGVSKENGAASVTMSWTIVNDQWIICAGSLSPATAGPANIEKINGVSLSNIGKFNGIDIADIAKINGID